MKRAWLVTPLALLLILAWAQGEEKSASSDYYASLTGLLSPPGPPAGPRPGSSGTNLVLPFKKVAGVFFGAGMEDLVKVWGRPQTIEQRVFRGVRTTDLGFGGNRFRFEGNRLVEAYLARAALPRMRLMPNITFQSTRKQLTKALGDPAVRKQNDRLFIYITDEGTIQFRFSEIGSRIVLLSVRLTATLKGKKK